VFAKLDENPMSAFSDELRDLVVPDGLKPIFETHFQMPTNCFLLLRRDRGSNRRLNTVPVSLNNAGKALVLSVGGVAPSPDEILRAKTIKL
jgi:hypothetical protein